MSHFLLYAIPGLPYGCVFALVGVGLVLTYKTSGVFNLAFGAQAYLSASVYYKTVSGHHWNRVVAAVVAVLVVGVALGWLLDRLLFRHIRTAPPVVKLITSLGLLVGLPSVVDFVLGSGTKAKNLPHQATRHRRRRRSPLASRKSLNVIEAPHVAPTARAGNGAPRPKTCDRPDRRPALSESSQTVRWDVESGRGYIVGWPSVS